MAPKRRSSRDTVQPVSYKERPHVNGGLPRTIYRPSSVPRRKRSRWPQPKRPTGAGGKQHNPIVVGDSDEEPPSPCGSTSTRQYAYAEDEEACCEVNRAEGTAVSELS